MVQHSLLLSSPCCQQEPTVATAAIVTNIYWTLSIFRALQLVSYSIFTSATLVNSSHRILSFWLPRPLFIQTIFCLFKFWSLFAAHTWTVFGPKARTWHTSHKRFNIVDSIYCFSLWNSIYILVVQPHIHCTPQPHAAHRFISCIFVMVIQVSDKTDLFLRAHSAALFPTRWAFSFWSPLNLGG